MTAPDLDVLVPTRNRPVELATTLAGLAAQEYRFGVIVSDQSDNQPGYATPAAQTLLRVLRAAGHPIQVTRHVPVVVQQRVMARFGGAGILPSGAYHRESPTTVPDRTVNAVDSLGVGSSV